MFVFYDKKYHENSFLLIFNLPEDESLGKFMYLLYQAQTHDVCNFKENMKKVFSQFDYKNGVEFSE
jgi:hypothetical protein